MTKIRHGLLYIASLEDSLEFKSQSIFNDHDANINQENVFKYNINKTIEFFSYNGPSWQYK